MFLDYFNMLISKIIFFFKKNIILIYFKIKNTLKNNCYHIQTHSHPLMIVRKSRHSHRHIERRYRVEL
jgi:hypothetical protein